MKQNNEVTKSSPSDRIIPKPNEEAKKDDENISFSKILDGKSNMIHRYLNSTMQIVKSIIFRALFFNKFRE
jgi:hypothetical protein